MKIEKVCPNCDIVALGKREIKKIFGFRIIGGIERPQSYCKEDRRKNILKNKKRKEKNPKLKTNDLRLSINKKTVKSKVSKKKA